jgi:hypothetical protein
MVFPTINRIDLLNFFILENLRLYVFEYDVEVYLIQLLHNHILHIYVVFRVYVWKRKLSYELSLC